MGTERRAPSAAELERMQSLVQKAMRDGAVGFSTGLQYVPGTYADQAEIVALAKTAAQSGGLYATHMRNEGTELEAAVKEALDIGAAAQMPGRDLAPQSGRAEPLGRAAKSIGDDRRGAGQGMRVNADVYLYDAASSTLGIRFPSWALEGGQDEINKRLDDAATWAASRRK